MIKWKGERLDFLKEFVPGHSYKEIHEEYIRRFGEDIKITQIRAAIKNHKLNTGRTGRFEKGHVPANKGKKIPAKGRSVETQFKQGHMPYNHKPVGTESLRSDGYWWVKVAEPKTWRQKHKIIYEQLHGEIPKGHVVMFADQDRSNFSPENLILVTKNQVARMNQNKLVFDNTEATKTGAAIAQLMIKTYERQKELKK